VKFGAVTATTSDYLVKAGEGCRWTAGRRYPSPAITASGSTSFEITTGSGLAGVSQAGGTGGGGGGNVNVNQVGGASYALGQNTMVNSQPVVLASDQTNVPGNLKQVNGSAISLGQTTKSASLPVTLASDTGTLPVSVTDRTEITGTASSAAVLSNFPVTDTAGNRCLCCR
jgi:hypothetical protein